LKNEGGEFQIEVLALKPYARPAAVAQALYRESEASIAARAKATAERKAISSSSRLARASSSKRIAVVSSSSAAAHNNGGFSVP